VEEQAEDGRAHPPLPLHGGGHAAPNDGGHVRARPGVEVGRQLRVRRAAEDDGEGDEGGQPDEDGHGRLHQLSFICVEKRRETVVQVQPRRLNNGSIDVYDEQHRGLQFIGM
jgi:hypothetical protein